MAPETATAVTVVEGRAFATPLRIAVTDPDRMAAARAAIDQVVRAVDETCSRFRDDSELSRLHHRQGQATAVSPLLARALRAALRAARLSDGAVDPTVGTAVKAAGYTSDYEDVARDGEALTLVASPVPGWQRIRLDPVRNTVFIPAGVELDLGSTAKALAADLAAEDALAAMGSGGVLVSIGGDIATAGTPPPGGWIILAAEDSNAPPDGEGERIAIHDGGMATSSTTVRQWRRGGVSLHHIIDPGTGLPATGPWRTVSVVAGNCLDANIAATAAIVLGAAAPAWLQTRHLPSRLVAQTGEVTHTSGWPHPASR